MLDFFLLGDICHSIQGEKQVSTNVLLPCEQGKFRLNPAGNYPASRGYTFAVLAGVQKVASADNRSIFYRACMKFITWFVGKINHQVYCQMAWFCGNKKIATTLICYARLSQCSKPVKNRKKPIFLNLFVQISGLIWTVVGRGYFSHTCSHSKSVTSADRVMPCRV